MVVLSSSEEQATAASDITDRRYQYSYYTNGDFQQDGDNKQFMFYEYLPSGLTWDSLNQMTVNAVAEGTRCKYRVLGYKSGGGGTLCYDSGFKGEFGIAIDITGANFDYFNVILSVYDDSGQQYNIGNIDSCYIVYAWGELVQLPTTPPALVDSAEAIESGINGTATETLPTVLTTVTYTTIAIDKDSAAADINYFGAGWQIVQYTFGFMYDRAASWTTYFLTAMMFVALLSYVLSKGW